MSAVGSVLENVVAAHLLNGLKPQGMSPLKGAAAALIIFFIIMGSGLLLYAFYLHLTVAHGDAMAAAMTGTMAFLLAAILMLAMGMTSLVIRKVRQRRIKQLENDLLKGVEAVLAPFENHLGTPIRDYPKTAVALASAMGFFLGHRVL